MANSDDLGRFASHVAEECAKKLDEEAEAHEMFRNRQVVIAIDNVADAIRSLYKPTA